MRRRELWRRAERWARCHIDAAIIGCRYSAAEGYAAGYRAAMRDARKLIAIAVMRATARRGRYED